jgi:hypothetical protein
LALIKCTECGRTVSDKASFCVGCGAPLERHAEVSQKPERPSGPAPSRKQLLARAMLCAVIFALGVAWSGALKQPAGGGPAAIAAALLVIVGLCGVIVSAVQWYTSRK